MIETWRDAWFESGTRVIYLVPKELVDKVLPLQIAPQPAAVERVFVGRVELLAPWREAKLLAASTPEALEDSGRFLDNFASQITRTSGQTLHRGAYNAAINRIWETARISDCVR